MSVVSNSVHAVSRQPPPTPIQLDEYSASPALRCFAFGTIHSPATEWKDVPFSMLPCVYPAQLKDRFAATTAIGRAIWRGADGKTSKARRTSNTARRTTKRPQTACHSLRFGHDSHLCPSHAFDRRRADPPSGGKDPSNHADAFDFRGGDLAGSRDARVAIGRRQRRDRRRHDR